MIEITAEEIIEKGQKLAESTKKWHFHIFTPDCVFNEKKQFALVLENTADNETYVNFSDTKQESEGKILLELLHGIKADEKHVASDFVSESVRNMEARVKVLTKKGIQWHHHALFPDCTFNNTKGKWVVMLEDPETKEVIESITDRKPDADLQIIESLFYHQK